MAQSDTEISDPIKRQHAIHQLDTILRQDYVLLPLYAFPSFAAGRADKINGPIDQYINSPEGTFWNLYAWSLRP